MRRDHQGGWRVGVTGLTAGRVLVFFLSPVYGESPPPHDVDGLRQTMRSLQDCIERPAFGLAYDRVLPTHLVGVEFAGTLRRGPTSLQ
jgi:hypothetical protein